MKINFVTSANETLASYRYHNKIPAKVLSGFGHETMLSLRPQNDYDVYIFSKHFNYAETDYAQKMKAQGKKVIYHCCDNHFNTKHKEHYKNMLTIADIIIAPTPQMAGIIERELNKKAYIIPDTYEFALAEPQFAPDSPIKCLWFGHHSNLNGLFKILPELTSSDIALTICTTEGINIEAQVEKGDRFIKDIRIVTWSKETLLNELKRCDIAIIPSALEEKDVVKSHNRLCESVIRGKFVIGAPVPSYNEYKNWLYIGNIKEGLNWLKKQKQEEILDRISNCQKYIKAHYSPEIIGRQWEAICQS